MSSGAQSPLPHLLPPGGVEPPGGRTAPGGLTPPGGRGAPGGSLHIGSGGRRAAGSFAHARRGAPPSLPGAHVSLSPQQRQQQRPVIVQFPHERVQRPAAAPARPTPSAAPATTPPSSTTPPTRRTPNPFARTRIPAGRSPHTPPPHPMAAHGLATPAQQHTFDINTGLDAVIGRKQAGRIAGFTRRQRELHTQLLRAHSHHEIAAYQQRIDEYQRERLAELRGSRQTSTGAGAGAAAAKRPNPTMQAHYAESKRQLDEQMRKLRGEES